MEGIRSFQRSNFNFVIPYRMCLSNTFLSFEPEVGGRMDGRVIHRIAEIVNLNV